MNIGNIQIYWPITSALFLVFIAFFVVKWFKKTPRKFMNKYSFFSLMLLALIVNFQISPMASDDQMIAYFKANKPALEKLVDNYRYFSLPDKNVDADWIWLQKPENKAMINELGVYRIRALGWTWLPDPYKGFSSKRIIISKDTNFSELRKYSDVDLQLKGDGYREFWWGAEATMFKSIVHFPQVPRVKGGFFWRPYANEYSVKHPEKYRVLESLDRPVNPKKLPGHCAYRMLEPQWFLKLCFSYPSHS